MPQAVWSGYLSFGLVSVPVGLYSATDDRSIHFNQLHRGTNHRIRYRKVDEVTGEELASEDIVRGYAVGGGRYVVVEDEELRDIAPGRSELIEVSDFVDLGAIDPVHFQRTYYLVPKNKAAEKAYHLLREAMRRQGKVGIATLVMRDKEYLVAVRPSANLIALETLYFADEIRPTSAVMPEAEQGPTFTEREMEMAEQLIGSLTARWEPERYHDGYRERVMALIEAKRDGTKLELEEAEPKANVLDLVAALEASVSRARASRFAAAAVASAASTKTLEGEAKPLKGEQQAFEGMSKAELLELAEQRDVPGRSKMTKLQLVQALSESEPAEERARGRRRSAS